MDMHVSHERPYRLMILLTQLERAGIQKCAFNQARYFHKRGYHVIFCVFYDKYGLLNQVQKEEPYRVISLDAKILGGSKLMNGLRTIRAVWRLSRLIKHEKIQVIETLGEHSNILGLTVARLAGVPLRFASQRNSLIARPKWFHRLDAWMVNANFPEKMVAVSEQTRRFCVDVEGMRPEKVVVIPNGVRVEEFAPSRWPDEAVGELRRELRIPENAYVVLTIGRLHPQKGHRYLIEAVRSILKEYTEIRFLFVGEGEHRSELEEQVQSSGLHPFILFLGERFDVPKLLAISDLFVLPSLYEGMPNVILEAMAARLAVVATDVDGTREVVVDGETGLLIPPADPTALQQAILTLLRDDGFRHSLGECGYQRVLTQFSEQLMCERYEQLLTSKLGDLS